MPDEISHIDLSKLGTMEQMRSIIMVLMNTVESMSAKIAAQEKEIQELKDTINLLKREQGRPQITGSGKKPNKDVSSQGKEKERQEKREEKQPISIAPATAGADAGSG